MPKWQFGFGIDLGITRSPWWPTWNDNGCPEVTPNAERQKTTPSVLLIEGDNIRVGPVDLGQCINKRDNVVRWIKRSIDDTTEDRQF